MASSSSAKLPVAYSHCLDPAAAADRCRASEDVESLDRSACVPLDEVLTAIGDGYFHARLWWICGFGFAAASMEVVVMAFLLPAIRDSWKLDNYQLGMLPTIVGIGSIFGELLCSSIADHFGRRWVFWATTTLVAVFGMLSAFSPNVAWLCVLRIVVGFGFGGSIAVDFPLYCEFLPTSARNKRLFQMQVLWPAGQFFTCVIAWLTIPRLGVGIGWRVFCFACAVPCIISACLRPLIPESPRWLLIHQRYLEATDICKDIAIVNGKRPEEVGLSDGVRVILENELTAVQPPRRQRKRAWPLAMRLFAPGLVRTTLGILMFAVSLHAAGYGLLTLMPILLQRKGISPSETYSVMTVTAIAEIPGVLLAMMVANRWGRLLPMKFTLLFVAAALACLAYAKQPLAVICSSCFGALFLEAGWSLLHVYVPEAYPTELRATALGTLSALSSMLSAWVPLYSAFVLETGNTMHTVLFFSSICILGSFSASMWLNVETLGRDLEDRIS